MSQILKEGSRGLSTENWRVYHPNGKHMFTCGERKANWYIERELAEEIGDKKIKLTFAPKGYGFKENETFGLAGRIIQCVVSGESEKLQRHHIVPYCYRTHFPEEYKSKNHHDVVLVTHKVHEAYELEATKYKNELADVYGVKTLSELNLEYTKVLAEFSVNKTKMLAKLHAIFRSYGDIPQSVIKDNLKFVSEQTNISYDKLASLNYLQLWKLYTYLREKFGKEFEYFKKERTIKFDHGYHLVQKLETHDDIEHFVKLWRKHFIDTMNPPYMPEGWSIDFRVKVEL